MARKNSTRAAQGSGTIRKKTVTRKGKEYTFWEARVTVGRDPGTGKQIQKSLDVYGHVSDRMKEDGANRMQGYIESVSGL